MSLRNFHLTILTEERGNRAIPYLTIVLSGIPRNCWCLLCLTHTTIPVQLSCNLFNFDLIQGRSLCILWVRFISNNNVFIMVVGCHCKGWVKTFQQYYNEQTKHILDKMLTKLEQYPRMRFIYAEMSFFSTWWQDLDVSRREAVKKFVCFLCFLLFTVLSVV